MNNLFWLLRIIQRLLCILQSCTEHLIHFTTICRNKDKRLMNDEYALSTRRLYCVCHIIGSIFTLKKSKNLYQGNYVKYLAYLLYSIYSMHLI